jgi:hypothetical protein
MEAAGSLRTTVHTTSQTITFNKFHEDLDELLKTVDHGNVRKLTWVPAALT